MVMQVQGALKVFVVEEFVETIKRSPRESSFFFLFFLKQLISVREACDHHDLWIGLLLITPHFNHYCTMFHVPFKFKILLQQKARILCKMDWMIDAILTLQFLPSPV